MASWRPSTFLHHLEQQPADDGDSAGLQLDDEDGGTGDAGDAAAASGDSSFRTSRIGSEPGDKRDGGSDRVFSFRVDVSAARGITMDVVSGSVCAKTPPRALSPGGSSADSPNGMPSMVDLAAAVDEAAAQTPTVSPTTSPGPFSAAEQDAADAAVELAAADSVERMFRATSSAALVSPFVAGRSQGPSKRAKSGVSLLDAGVDAAARTAAANGPSVGWIADTNSGRPTDVERLSMRIAAAVAAAKLDAGVRAPAARRAGGRKGKAGARPTSPPMLIARSFLSAEDGEEGGVGGDAAVAAATATPVAPHTNETWLLLLSPLVRTLPAKTHPEDFLHEILRERGYSTQMVSVKDTAFFRTPEPDQVAAYDKVILSAVLDEDEAALERLRAAGRRMDACNRFGDSVLHMACRRGRARALRYFLRVCGPQGVVLSDDFGRTVMHDACWTATPRFDVASAVLDVDTRLLRMLDSRGSSPLQYVPQDQWPLWCAFFESRKEVYWPRLAPGEQDVGGVIPLRKTGAQSGVS